MDWKNPVQEVRKAEPDGTTSYLRPMPGADRMYPETDVEPIIITKERISSIKLPELLTEKAMRLEKAYKLNPDLAKEIVKEEIGFESYAKEFKNIEPKLIATILTAYPKELKSRYDIDPEKLKENHFKEVLGYLDKGKVSKEAVIDLLADAAKGNKIDISKFEGVGDSELRKELEKIVGANKGASINALMGDAMKRFRGKADGKKIMDILKSLL